MSWDDYYGYEESGHGRVPCVRCGIDVPYSYTTIRGSNHGWYLRDPDKHDVDFEQPCECKWTFTELHRMREEAFSGAWDDA